MESFIGLLESTVAASVAKSPGKDVQELEEMSFNKKKRGQADHSPTDP